MIRDDPGALRLPGLGGLALVVVGRVVVALEAGRQVVLQGRLLLQGFTGLRVDRLEPGQDRLSGRVLAENGLGDQLVHVERDPLILPSRDALLVVGPEGLAVRVAATADHRLADPGQSLDEPDPSLPEALPTGLHLPELQRDGGQAPVRDPDSLADERLDERGGFGDVETGLADLLRRLVGELAEHGHGALLGLGTVVAAPTRAVRAGQVAPGWASLALPPSHPHQTAPVPRPQVLTAFTGGGEGPATWG